VGNFALAAAGAYLLYRLFVTVRKRSLWRVRSRLALSYIFIGVVPILLLVTFVVVGVLLLFFNISSYLVQNRLDGLTDQASMLARTTLVEIQHTVAADWADRLSARQAAIAARYPGAALAIVPTSGRPRAASRPRWSSRRPFRCRRCARCPQGVDARRSAGGIAAMGALRWVCRGLAYAAPGPARRRSGCR